MQCEVLMEMYQNINGILEHANTHGKYLRLTANAIEGTYFYAAKICPQNHSSMDKCAHDVQKLMLKHITDIQQNNLELRKASHDRKEMYTGLASILTANPLSAAVVQKYNPEVLFKQHKLNLNRALDDINDTIELLPLDDHFAHGPARLFKLKLEKISILLSPHTDNVLAAKYGAITELAVDEACNHLSKHFNLYFTPILHHLSFQLKHSNQEAKTAAFVAFRGKYGNEYPFLHSLSKRYEEINILISLSIENANEAARIRDGLVTLHTEASICLNNPVVRATCQMGAISVFKTMLQHVKDALPSTHEDTYLRKCGESIDIMLWYFTLNETDQLDLIGRFVTEQLEPTGRSKPEVY